ncbi:type II toxin-antitoxin system VapC family toxin [Micromonospora sp. H33]|uniref:type II toxin-antitoxin system VapC family toxin n=1 Tax=Micromonospora sp. H33 TaxID=3452215 RepID=UPI003F8877B7
MSDRLRAVASRPEDSATTLVDTNVLLDIFTDDPRWAAWSGDALAEARDAGVLVVNPIVYAEVSVRFDTIEALDEALPAADFLREELPYPAGFLAGKAYATYRSQGGAKRSPIADFYIGAHAAVCGYRLLTRDGSRYRTYFPKLDLITPES